MKNPPKRGVHGRSNGFTLLELLLIVATTGILVALIIPTLIKARERMRTTECINQMRQAGIALISYAGDNKDRFPMQKLRPRNAEAHLDTHTYLKALTNYLDTPKIFNCPSGTNQPASHWDLFGALHLDYFLNANARVHHAQTILMGDQEWQLQGQALKRAVWVTEPQHARWSDKIHADTGNLLFADGHVESTSSEDLATALFLSIREKRP